jgi:hypothetical protein
MTERLFASRPVKLHDGRWFVATSRSPWTCVVMQPRSAITPGG